jgi:hypothetical protein
MLALPADPPRAELPTALADEDGYRILGCDLRLAAHLDVSAQRLVQNDRFFELDLAHLDAGLEDHLTFAKPHSPVGLIEPAAAAHEK